MEIISRTYKEIEVIFNNSDSLYINATKIAKHFKKKPDDWLRTKQTKEYIEAIYSHFGNMRNGDLVVVRKGGNDKSITGTWIHRRLIIAFARWLSPDFAVWCDLQIEDILSLKVVPKNSDSKDIDLKRMLSDIQIIRSTFG